MLTLAQRSPGLKQWFFYLGPMEALQFLARALEPQTPLGPCWVSRVKAQITTSYEITIRTWGGAGHKTVCRRVMGKIMT